MKMKLPDFPEANTNAARSAAWLVNLLLVLGVAGIIGIVIAYFVFGVSLPFLG